MVRDSLVVFATVAVFGIVLGCGPRAPSTNVVLISIDTLRADHLGCYGYPRETTPNIDAFRRDGALFAEAIAHAPSTLPAHASILTSLLPSHHGASVANSFGLDPAAVTLTDVLKQRGYATASFNGGIQLDPLYGLDRGFDVYQAARPSVAIADLLVDPIDMFDHVVDEAMSWIQDRGDEPFFLFLHTYEVHHPYTPKPELLALFASDDESSLPDSISVELLERINAGEITLEPGDLAHIINTYDAEVRSVDGAFGRFIDFLRERRLYDNTIIALTSDHGEEFGEHGFVGWHSHTLYDELLRVPLIFKFARSEHSGATVDSLVRGIDISPTILAALDLAVPPTFEGANLLGALMDSASVPEFAVSRKDVPVTDEFASIRTRKWKWFRGHLFDLENDPGEARDVSKMNADIAASLEKKLDELVAARPIPRPHVVKPDEELLEKLRALGYIR